MDKFSAQKNSVAQLYPPIDPFDQRRLDVGDGHTLYVEQSGNPNGLPVVVFHGGPGGGCSPIMRRYFDPSVYRIILFDQRGCGRSEPHASTDHNTTWHLVRDIELIRDTLGIDQWIVFGGSWGATLGLVYAQEHPDRVIHLVLRGVFLMTREELDWFYGGSAGRFWPEHWANFTRMIPEEERSDLIAAYNKRLFSGNRSEELRFAQAWATWENSLASIESGGMSIRGSAHYAHAFSRIENHYFINGGFLSEETQIMNRTDRLKDIPGHIVQGRYDMICPPNSAYGLSEAWMASRLVILDKAGHALSEPGITRELLQIMDHLAAT